MLKILSLAEAGPELATVRKRLTIFERESSARAAALTRKVFGHALSPQQVVDRIVSDVRELGDQAVIDYTLKLDGAILTPDMFRVDAAAIARAEREAPESFKAAVRLAAENVRLCQRNLLHTDRRAGPEGAEAPEAVSSRFEEVLADLTFGDMGDLVRREAGGSLQWKYTPIRSAACYVPGGLAPYPSTVIMSVVPAQVAGVGRVVVASPPRKGSDIDPLVLATCGVLGVREVYRVGGVQAIAALAYGTASIPNVDKIVGPGNLFVMLAKKAVYGHADIDMFAGPSEILVLADADANPAFVAADMLSQAEHDEMASAMLVTDSRELAEAVAAEIERQLPGLNREATARAAIERFGLAVIVADMDAGVEVANDVAPEHLEVMTRDADDVAARLTAAGAVFIGPWTPEAVGDYVAGSSHILPTGGTARFLSGLSANSFLKATAYVKFDAEQLAKVQSAIQALAEAEGYDAHAKSARMRGDR